MFKHQVHIALSQHLLSKRGVCSNWLSSRPILTRSSAMAEGPRDALVSIEKSLQSTNNLDIHPRSSQLLLLNGRTEYHFRFGIICMILRLAVLIQYRSTTAALSTLCIK